MSEFKAASAATPPSAAAPTVDQSWDQSHALTEAAPAVSHLEEENAEKKDSMKAGEAHAVVDTEQYAVMVAAKTETTENKKESSVGEKEAAAAQAERAEFATEAAEDHREDAASKIVAAFWASDKSSDITIIVPDGVTMIPDGACSIAMGRVGKLMTSIVFPTSLKSIGDFAFGGCTALPSIVFPPSLKTIGRSAFTGCIALSSIVFSETESLTSIGDYAFSGCTSLPAIVLAPSLETIGSGAFCGCTALAMVEFPDTLTSIGDRAFMKCDSLPAVVLPAYV